jgi:hypothetical protein
MSDLHEASRHTKASSRATRACLPCAKSRRRCEGAEVGSASCSMCRHRGITCVFDAAPQKKRGPKGPRKQAAADAGGIGIGGGSGGALFDSSASLSASSAASLALVMAMNSAATEEFDDGEGADGGEEREEEGEGAAEDIDRAREHARFSAAAAAAADKSLHSLSVLGKRKADAEVDRREPAGALPAQATAGGASAQAAAGGASVPAAAADFLDDFLVSRRVSRVPPAETAASFAAAATLVPLPSSALTMDDYFLIVRIPRCSLRTLLMCRRGH